DRVAVFRDGRIEQVAAPETLYEEPERAFVAHFIGENNLLAGTVVGSDGDICVVDTQGGTVHAFDVAGSAPGDEVLLAIRPERVGVQPDGVSADSVSDDSVSDDTGHYANELAAAVVDVVFIGDHLRVRLKVGERDDFIAKIPNIVGHGRELPGDTVRIGWATLDCRALPPDPTVLQTEDDR
ncbi:MAG: TOBE domain-containing protein, partial [Gammaproteobacteria bacterium]|nr:TOBE domain-containing protein [Gammaproteobacteria bacterium]